MRQARTLRQIGEHAFLRALMHRLRARGAPQSPWGPGDDAARLRAVEKADLLCCDSVLEDVDFRRRWASFADVGHKAAAINLSDLAAMGARPTALLAHVAISPDEAASDAMALLLAIDACARAHGARLCGGDLSRSWGPLMINVTAAGVAPPRMLQRHRGRPGDVIAVGGPLGEAHAGLLALDGFASAFGAPRAALAAQRRPRPQIALGRALARLAGVRSACDVSDGLLADVLRLCAPGAGAHLDTTRLPISKATWACARRWAAMGRQQKKGADAPQALVRQWALSGGEDYVLLVAVRASAWPQAVRLAARCHERLVPIGRITAQPGVRLWPPTDAQAVGFDHFAKAAGTPTRNVVRSG